MSYSIVIIRPKNLRIDCKQTKKLTGMKTYTWTQKQRKKFEKLTLSVVNTGLPERVSLLSTKCGGCHPKGLIVTCSHKIKQIIIILKFIYAKANSPFC